MTQQKIIELENIINDLNQQINDLEDTVDIAYKEGYQIGYDEGYNVGWSRGYAES